VLAAISSCTGSWCGLIALHDVVPGPEERVGGVADFWKVVKKAHQTRELVYDWEQSGWGVGVLEVPPEGLNLEGLLRELRTEDDLWKPEPPE
jgi:hypothetical protein